ncbi:hypothetical protein [uncultured Sphingomonas sp.]|uniref:hypothetical protein n=1 Tax=uncultured Sphingomonas sp. TaxID=158754 RepID=UPI0025E2DCA4|nr:hypothetical protein [uncultured Sphingomonas sp.]
MLIITDAHGLADALDTPFPCIIKRLLMLRADLIDLATFVIAAPGDRIEAIEAAAGIPVIANLVDGSRFGEPGFMPSFEWVADHGGLFEAPFILTDDGGGVVLIVPDDEGVDHTLLSLLRAHADRALGDDLGGT